MDKLIAEARALCTASDVDGNVMADTMARLVAALEAAEARAARVEEALQGVLNPIAKLERDMEPGHTLDGAMATRLAADPEYLRSIARAALAGGRDA